MPIDPNFQKKRKKVGKADGVAIWGPLNPPKTLGIHGTGVAVDWDVCTGCGVCFEVCPQQLYEWAETLGHPTSEKKVIPAKEADCVQCYKCETKCPVRAIRIVFPGPTGWMAYLLYLFFPQAIGGIIYGVLFGPSLGLQTLFYLGWAILPIGLLFFVSLVIFFRRKGKPGEGKGLMDTTVLVDSGTYAIVRHPQVLGSILLMSASALISQHWLVTIAGVIMSASFYNWIVKQEERLLMKFGSDYKRYMRKVPRMNFVIGILRLLRRKRETR